MESRRTKLPLVAALTTTEPSAFAVVLDHTSDCSEKNAAEGVDVATRESGVDPKDEFGLRMMVQRRVPPIR